MQTDGTAHRYEALDGLRGVAALTVMFGHFGLLLGVFSVPNGLLAVDTFFIMSGFVIAYAYGERLRRGMPAWAYLYRRAVRLYPMFVIGLLMGTLILYYGARSGAIAYPAEDLLRGTALNLFYIPFANALPIQGEVGQVFPANPPAWSLFFEMLASGAFLLLFGGRTRMLLLATVLWYAVLVAAGVHYANGGSWFNVHNGYYTSNLAGGLPRVGFGFSLGVLLHALVRDGTAGARIRALAGRVPYASFGLYAAALAMLLFPKSAHGLYPLLTLVTVAPAIVFVGAQIRVRAGLERNIAVFLGWISYPIYCLHYPVIRLAIILRGGEHGGAYGLLAVSAAVSLALAMALTRWYEEPVRAALSGLSFARPPGPAPNANDGGLTKRGPAQV